MLTFTMSALAHETGKVADAADREAVKLTRHGRDRYVLLRIEEYDRMKERATDPRRAFLTAEMPDDLYDLLADDIAKLETEQA